MTVPPPPDLRDRRVLITSGPTREFLDPIRFLTSASSGAMGFALAAAARDRGARVTVISGPTGLPAPRGVTVVPVTTARQMLAQALRRAPDASLIFGAAAVSDWRFRRAAPHKIKHDRRALRLTVVPNPDIIKAVASRRRPGQIVVGFALETRGLARSARAKLIDKDLDLIVANGPASLSSQRARVTLVSRRSTRRLPRSSKARVARAILSEAVKLLDPGT